MELAIDIVKPIARTKRELEDRRANRWQSELQSLPYYHKKNIEVRTEKECNPWTSSFTCPNNPHCGPFDHNLVGMTGGDLPKGFKEP